MGAPGVLERPTIFNPARRRLTGSSDNSRVHQPLELPAAARPDLMTQQGEGRHLHDQDGADNGECEIHLAW